MAYDFDTLIVDISEGCGPVDYEDFAENSGADGVIFRGTEGTIFDRYAKLHWRGFESVNMPFGVYGWHNPSDSASNNRRQAEKLVELVEWGGYYPKLHLYADYETDYKNLSINQMRQAIWKYIGVVETATEEMLKIYTGPAFWNGQVANAMNGWTDIPKDRRSWFANWNGKRPTYTIPEDWSRRYGQDGALMIQYTNRGWVAGINAAVDYSAFNGTRADFNKYFSLETQPHPVPDPDPIPDFPERIEIAYLPEGGFVNMRAEPFGAQKAVTWNGVQFKVVAQEADPQGRPWFYVADELCVSSWYTKAV